MPEDNELDELRRRRMADLQRQQEQQVMAAERQREVDQQKQAIMRQILTPEARDRLATLRMAYPDVVRSVEDQLIALVQAGRINQQVDDNTLKAILRKVAPQKRDITIERK
ncbi:MAG TPA: DNA-binding protein [Methanomassiliicoccales archaeon]|nr:DNA-binding protein [Methanomassiliicoccales archaeon]